MPGTVPPSLLVVWSLHPGPTSGKPLPLGTFRKLKLGTSGCEVPVFFKRTRAAPLVWFGSWVVAGLPQGTFFEALTESPLRAAGAS